MKRCILSFGALFIAAVVVQPARAIPQLVVTANHLGGGLVQYTLEIDNTDPGGNVAIQISVTGSIHQVPSAFFPDAPPNGGVDLATQADTSDMFDVGYQSLGGKAADSWWGRHRLWGLLVRRFNGALGGAVGSTLFSICGRHIWDRRPECHEIGVRS